MIINLETGIESNIPFQHVCGYHIDWKINQHAILKLTGEIIPGDWGKLSMQYTGTEMELFFINDLRQKEQTIFKGIISSVQFEYGDGSCKVFLKGISASKMLDHKKISRSFQNISMTHADIGKAVIEDEGGAAICTAGKNKIGKPSICYKETVWEYARRIASLSHTYLIPDIITGRPGIWIGMRKGIRIEENIDEWDCVNVVKKCDDRGKTKILVNYQITSRKFYLIGDYKDISGQTCVIYKLIMEYKKGELIFHYTLAQENELEVNSYFNENFIGLCLPGRVSRTENENVYIRLDIDKEEGRYPYTWRPETGNALYAMPELESPASLYFTGADEREAFGVGCVYDFDDLKCKKDDSALKLLETVYGDKVSLFPNVLGISKNGNHSLNLEDGAGINFSSEKEIHMEAAGKILLKAKKIFVSVPEEIAIVVN